MARLQAGLESGRVLRADVEQTIRSPYTDTPQYFTGSLVSQGERYRIEAPNQTVVTDGATIWVYDERRKQVLVGTPSQDPTVLHPSDLFRVREDYDATLVETTQRDGVSHHVLRLSPKTEDAPFTDITLWVRASDALVTRVQATDVNDAVITIELSNLETAASTPDRTFTFDPPEGVEVVDLRS